MLKTGIFAILIAMGHLCMSLQEIIRGGGMTENGNLPKTGCGYKSSTSDLVINLTVVVVNPCIGDSGD